MNIKHCISCKKTKPTKEFGKCLACKDGLHYYCKECRKEKRRLNPESSRRACRKWQNRVRKTPRGYYNRIRDNARRKGIIFGITIGEFIAWFQQQELKCHYCKQTLEQGNGSLIANSCNIDRKDNKQGYSLDNIVIACRRCNSMKGDWLTYEQTKEIAQRYFRT